MDSWVTWLIIGIAALTLINGVLLSRLAINADRDRRVANFKTVVAAEAMGLSKQGASSGADLILERPLSLPSMPGERRGWRLRRRRSRDLRKRTRFVLQASRWVDGTYVVRAERVSVWHYRLVMLLRRSDHEFTVLLLWEAGESKLQALNAVLSSRGYNTIISDGSGNLEPVISPIVDDNGYRFGYLFIEPALRRQRRPSRSSSAQ